MNEYKNILFVVSNTAKLSNIPCGISLEEFAQPYLSFIKNNFNITTASPSGGNVAVSQSSDLKNNTEWTFAKEILKRTENINDIDEDMYEALFLTGGQGALLDFPYNKKLNQIIKKYCMQNKPIGALSHGIAAFIGVFSDTGEFILKNKSVSGLSNAEELLQFSSDKLPFLLEDKLKELGADYCYNENNNPFIIKTDNIITGQNHKASQLVAQQIIDLLTATG